MTMAKASSLLLRGHQIKSVKEQGPYGFYMQVFRSIWRTLELVLPAWECFGHLGNP